MINSDILSYIRTEMQKGTDRQTITNSLISNGWNTQDIAEGFSAIDPNVTVSSQIVLQKNNISMEKPSSVKRFEFLMYIALLIGLASSFVKYGGSFSYGYNEGLFLLMPLAYAIISFLLVWLAARHRKDWARWVVVVLVGLGLVSIVPSLFHALSSYNSLLGSGTYLLTVCLSLIQIILEIMAFCYVFSSASNMWFCPNNSQASLNTNPGIPVVNQLWNKTILHTNIGFLVTYLLLVFGLDLSIVISDKSLMGFWYIMLVVLAGYLVFFLLETFVFRNKFATSASSSDSGILTVIVLRNILFLLNFIPFIQLLGLAGLPTVGLILLVIYIVLIARRFNSIKIVRT